MQPLQQECANISGQQCCQPPKTGPPFMPVSVHSTLQYNLPEKNENDYYELYISILAHLFPIDLNINCYHAIKIIEMIK
jgi:hypothetical protein